MSIYSGGVNSVTLQNGELTQQSREPRQESMQEDEISAIVHYSEMQEKLLSNLRQQLGRIRGGGELLKTPAIQQSSSAYNEQPHSQRSLSILAFKNAAVAARKLPSKNFRNLQKQNRQSHQNPKRNYPRPWAMEKVSTASADHNNNLPNHSFRPPKKTMLNPQKQFYSSSIERHQRPNQLRATYMDNFAMDPFHNLRPVCQNCQSPILMVGNLASGANPNNGVFVETLNQETHPVFHENVNSYYGQHEEAHQVVVAVPTMKTSSKKDYSANTWNIGEDSLEPSTIFDLYESQENLVKNNGVLFPDPQTKKHPYLMRILEKTIPGFGTKTTIAYEVSKSIQMNNNNQAPSKKQESFKQFPGNSPIAFCETDSGGNPMITNPSFRHYNFRHEDSPQRAPVMNRRDFEDFGQCIQDSTPVMSPSCIERKETTLLRPRYIISSLCPSWSQRSVKEGSQPYPLVSKEGLNHKNEDSNANIQVGDNFNKDSSKKVILEDKDGTVGLRKQEENKRAVTYKVFPDQDATKYFRPADEDWTDTSVAHTKNESDTIQDPGESPELAEENKKLSNATQRKRKCKRRNHESSGDESYGSMKVTRDPREDLINRIDEDFQSFEDMCKLEMMFEEETNNNSFDEKEEQLYRTHIPRGDVDTLNAVHADSNAKYVKTKDSRSNVRNRKLSLKKRNDSSVSVESCRLSSSVKLPVAKKSASWASQNGAAVMDPSQNRQQWPPLVIEKYFPEVEKVLEEARILSPYVDNLDKMFQGPVPVEKVVEDKKPWGNSKLSKFPSWFRDVEPISKLGEHLTISKAFHIDIKPGQFKCQELEKFVANSVGAFHQPNELAVDAENRHSMQTPLRENNNSKKSIIVEEKPTKILRRSTKSEQSEFSDSENMKRIRQLASVAAKVENTKKHNIQKKLNSLLAANTRNSFMNDFSIPTNLVPKVNAAALKVLTSIGNPDADVIANQAVGNETRLKNKPSGLPIGISISRSAMRKKNKSLMQAMKAKSSGRVQQYLENQNMTLPLENNSISTKTQENPKFDRKQLKLLLEKPELFTQIASKLIARDGKEIELPICDRNTGNEKKSRKGSDETRSRPQTRKNEGTHTSKAKTHSSRKSKAGKEY